MRVEIAVMWNLDHKKVYMKKNFCHLVILILSYMKREKFEIVQKKVSTRFSLLFGIENKNGHIVGV